VNFGRYDTVRVLAVGTIKGVGVLGLNSCRIREPPHFQVPPETRASTLHKQRKREMGDR